jgi:hypothetical protein
MPHKLYPAARPRATYPNGPQSQSMFPLRVQMGAPLRVPESSPEEASRCRPRRDTRQGSGVSSQGLYPHRILPPTTAAFASCRWTGPTGLGRIPAESFGAALSRSSGSYKCLPARCLICDLPSRHASVHRRACRTNEQLLSGWPIWVGTKFFHVTYLISDSWANCQVAVSTPGRVNCYA